MQAGNLILVSINLGHLKSNFLDKILTSTEVYFRKSDLFLWGCLQANYCLCEVFALCVATWKTENTHGNIFYSHSDSSQNYNQKFKCFSASCTAVALYYTTEKHMHAHVQTKELMISQQATSCPGERPLVAQRQGGQMPVSTPTHSTHPHRHPHCCQNV